MSPVMFCDLVDSTGKLASTPRNGAIWLELISTLLRRRSWTVGHSAPVFCVRAHFPEAQPVKVAPAMGFRTLGHFRTRHPPFP
jgi:hypothetical protein